MSFPLDPHGHLDPVAVRRYHEAQANNRHGFLKGGQLDTPVPTLLRMEFGEWQAPADMAGDTDLDVLEGLHGLARKSYDDMIETIQSVAGDDDPSLNHDGRLKIAAKIIEPKLGSLATMAERELARVDQRMATLESEITKAVRTADPVDVALHSDIRAHIRSMKTGEKAQAVRTAIERGDITTLQAIVTAPPYLSGFEIKSGDEGMTRIFREATAAAREHMAPAQVKHLAALQQAKATTLQGLAALHRRSNALIDFNRAHQLNELETKRNSKHKETP